MPTERFQFTGEGGHQLAAALDLPEQEPLAYALFAHCFTCGKDVLAAKRIAVALAAKGIAVLRAGSYELEHRKDVPGRVVVSEYVDVAHAFVDGDETGMVNAVLDQIARQFRADEFGRG